MENRRESSENVDHRSSNSQFPNPFYRSSQRFAEKPSEEEPSAFLCGLL
jgi:hypothetical protein